MAVSVDGRAARVPRVRSRVGLDLIRTDGADDAACHGAAQAVGAADEQQLVAGPRAVAQRLLPERFGADGLARNTEDREVALLIHPDHLGVPGAIVPLEIHLLTDLGDHVRGRDDIQLAVVDPAGEACTQAISRSRP